MVDDDSASFGRHRNVFENLGDDEPSTFLEAQAVIENIRADKGHLDATTMRDVNEMPARSRQKIMYNMEKIRDMEAAFTKSISEQLYSSKYRFLYELIQNADDSLYRNARQKCVAPYLRFRITPHEFIVETNEDGFTRANVEAICATGKSSKKTSALDNHIGEKGFGFKSVFSVADEVRIQSGVWAFCFRHQQGDDGLGMVTPLDAATEVLPEDVSTRMTLKLSDAAKEDYKRLLDAISDLPDTTIFFLHRLRTLEIHITADSSTESRTTITKYGPSLLHELPCIIRTFEHRGSKLGKTVERSRYHVFTHTVDKMPKDKRRQHRTSTKVELAFPLTPDGQPKISGLGQHVFAYLPLQRLSHLQFLIQSDFITSASRESVIDCAWNDAIVDGIATAFAKAVAEFATPDHPLRHSWLDYMPTKPMEGLWKNLYSSIQALLKRMPVLQTWEKRKFKCPPQLRRLVSDMIHEETPIFRDLPEEVYLAPEYNHRHYTTLAELGAVCSSWDEILPRISADLVNVNSYIKTRAPDQMWHEACARLLLSPFQCGYKHICLRIQKLPIIPLNNGRSWTGSPGVSPGGVRKIFFPDNDGIDIPNDISLNLVEKQAATSATRRDFFRKMGVEDCPKETVLSQIEATQKSTSLRTLEWASHSRYLFYFHPQPRSLTSWFYICANAKITRVRPSVSLFFPSDREYDTEQLLPKEYLASNSNGVVALLDKNYFNLVPGTIRRQNLSWVEWLRRAAGAQYHPSLAERFGTGPSNDWVLSPVILAVLERRPEKFVGLLRAHWSEYKHYVSKVSTQLMGCKVPCESGALLPLRTNYLPTIEIKARLHDLEVDSGFPLLRLPSVLDEANQQEWRFLEDIGVSYTIDNRFDEIVLRQMTASKFATTERAVKVYRSMAERSTLQDKEKLRSFFGSCNAIAVETSPNVLRWLAPSECIWNGPDFLTVKVPLGQHYGDEEHLANFFRIWLDIRDFELEDVFDELEHRQNLGQTAGWSNSEAANVYQFLENAVKNSAGWTVVRKAFTQRKLVLGADGRWHTIQSCLWNSPFSLAEYEDLSSVYPTLKLFFVNHLKIKNADPAMLINELSRMASDSEPRIADMRQRLIDVGRMVAKSSIDEKLLNALDKLRMVKFLPKKAVDGGIALVGVDDDFAIMDHGRFGAAFADQHILLDFALEEVQILDTVFRHMGITHRYLSTAINEVSSVADDAVQNEALEQALQTKAYALYCCAAKYKSVNALRGEKELFDQLSRTQIYCTDHISTILVLALNGTQISVQSDRTSLHYELSEGQLTIYVPESQRQRESCYRSQVPALLARLLGVSASATHAISLILQCKLEDLDEILLEQDIPLVNWIERPIIRVSDSVEHETPNNVIPDEDASGPDAIPTASRTPTQEYFAPESEAGHSRRTSRTWVNEEASTPPQTPSRQYERLLEQIVRSAHRATHGQRINGDTAVPLRNAPPEDDEFAYDHDHNAAFGDRDTNQMTHDKRIGAAGEAYVFEILSNLSLPNFSRENWRSTIRGELQGHSRYSDMNNWVGRETADIVFIDRDGSLTQYFREYCSGGLPAGIRQDRDFAANPIEYFLEVKTTTSACHTRFYMSGSQYNRMQNLAVPLFSTFNKVYVIFRVFNLASRDVGMKMFVDPLRLRGHGLEFEVGTWLAKVTGGV